MLKATILHAWRRGSFRIRVGVTVRVFHGSFRVQQLGLLSVTVIEFGTAVYRIAQILPSDIREISEIASSL